MNREELKKFYEKYELTSDDFYKHQHYTIITRTGVNKIQRIEGIEVDIEVLYCDKEFAAVKVTGKSKNGSTIQSLGSALYGKKYQNEQGKWIETGTTNSWYVLEIAEKRALSKCVLTLAGLYEDGVFGEDEVKEEKKTEDDTKGKKALNTAMDVIKDSKKKNKK